MAFDLAQLTVGCGFRVQDPLGMQLVDVVLRFVQLGDEVGGKDTSRIGGKVSRVAIPSVSRRPGGEAGGGPFGGGWLA